MVSSKAHFRSVQGPGNVFLMFCSWVSCLGAGHLVWKGLCSMLCLIRTWIWKLGAAQSHISEAHTSSGSENEKAFHLDSFEGPGDFTLRLLPEGDMAREWFALGYQSRLGQTFRSVRPAIQGTISNTLLKILS